MKTFFNYCFYRISKFYEDCGEKEGYIAGRIVVFASIGFLIATFLIFVFYLLDKKINLKIIWAIIVVTSILSFFMKKKKYIEMAEKYRDEKNRKLKGWLVFTYVISSFVIYIVSMMLCGYWVNAKV